jgi:chromosome segregation ATPase
MMNTIFKHFFIIALLLGSIVAAHAQDMTKDQWRDHMNAATMNRENLLWQVGQLESSIADLKKQDKSLADRLEKRRQSIIAMLSTTSEKINQFSKLLDRIDSRINELSKLPDRDKTIRRAEADTVQAVLNTAGKNRLSYLSEYIDRIPAEEDRLDKVRQ